MDKLGDKLRDKLGRRFTGSATGALAALLMVGAITLGTTVIQPMTANRNSDATTAQADDTSAGGHDGFAPGYAEIGAGQAGTAGSGAALCQDEQGNIIPCDEEPPHEQPNETPAPTPAPTPETPKDEPPDNPPSDNPPPPPAPSDDMTLDAVFNADTGKIVVEWSAFAGDFEKYKLVRSTDGDATWPLGAGDTLVAVVQPGDETRYVDGYAPCNTEFHYRAFAVVHVGDGYQVLASSNVDAATHACSADTPPEQAAMGFVVVQTADGVQMNWDACSSQAFAAYKVVRSATNPNPVYPLNDGTELIAYMHDSGSTAFVDSNVHAGQTWTYRVLCMGHNSHGWYALGQTAAVTVAVQ